MDSAFWDTMRWGTTTEWYFRWDVYNDNWDRILKVLESRGGVSCDATRRELTLGARDSTTGWRAKDFTETTVQGVFTPKGASQLAVVVGTYIKYDAIFSTADGFKEADEFIDPFGNYYEVKAVEDFAMGDSFSHRVLQLTKLPLHT